ncbi:MAG: TonB family protein [Cyclobacteriaceae bacterium]|jgi:TonB family protein
MASIQPTVTFNCPENWDKMKIGLVSRYCDSCKREVQDFTKLTREEILHFLLINRNNKVCGRIYQSQLDYHHQDMLVLIDSYIQKNKNSNLSFFLLTIGTITLLSCSTNNDLKHKQTLDSLTFVSSEQKSDFKESIESDTTNYEWDSPPSPEFALLGDIVLVDSLVTVDQENPQLENRVRVMAEVMPEFNGGIDSLYAYFNSKLKYPEWEKKQKIEGKVFVTFVVDADGKIKDPAIVRSVEGSKNFDEEVLRIIREMPDWKPGQDRGQNVAVQFTLPIMFRL